MRVATGRECSRLVAGAVLTLALGCGGKQELLSPPDTVVYVQLFNNTSSVDVSVQIVTAYGADTIPLIAGGTTVTNEPFGEAGDFLTFLVTAPGANNNVDCEVSPQIIVTEGGPAPAVFGQVNIVANGVTTTATCGNNWQ